MVRTSRALLAGVAIAIAAAGAPTRAGALKAAMLYGKWCGDIGTLEFTPNSFVVTRASDQVRGAFTIRSYEVRGSDITVHWLDATHPLAMTKYGDFSSDGSRMKQLPISGAAAREFHRC